MVMIDYLLNNRQVQCNTEVLRFRRRVQELGGWEWGRNMSDVGVHVYKSVTG
jgi:hypothetical protein